MNRTDQKVRRHHRYLSVRCKFLLAMCAASSWTAFSVWAAQPWIADLSRWIGTLFAIWVVGGIAIVPGFMNAFLVVSLLLDRRPVHAALAHYPPISILIAAYNEAASIRETLLTIELQRYPATMQVIVINDGSRDRTTDVVRGAQAQYPWLELIDLSVNVGKARALNEGLRRAQHELILTVDADSLLHSRALVNIIERYNADPPNTRAVAGAILVRNSRHNWLTRAQEWDYFVGIAAIKRVQSLYQGTLVAQGAFSVYDRQALREVGGWAPCVGEDIVLTWALLKAGYRVGHCEDAICFTNVPMTVSQFVRQRQRWARGMLEAFRQHPRILSTPRLSTFFIYWNLLFPWLDAAFAFAFVPGVVFALFGYYWIVGPMTLTLIPLAGLMSAVMVSVEKKTFKQLHLTVRRNGFGLLIYLLFYGFLLQPASVLGYLDEFLRTRKTWGTK